MVTAFELWAILVASLIAIVIIILVHHWGDKYPGQKKDKPDASDD